MAEIVDEQKVGDGQEVGDKLQNLIANLGTEQDKREHIQYTTRVLSYAELDALYSDDWIAAKMIDIPVEDMLREGRKISAPSLSADQIEAVEKVEAELFVEQKFEEALKWSRLYGGAVVVLGIEGAGEPDEPLDLNQVKPGSLKFLNVIDRFDLSVWGVNIYDPTAANYRLPTEYSVFGAQRIHYSRILRFTGARAPWRIQQRLNYWGLSVLQRAFDVITDAESTIRSVASMIWESNVDVITIDELKRQLSTPAGESALLKRFLMAKILKSNNNLLLLDSTEKYERKAGNISTSGIKDLIPQFLDIVAGASDIPSTRFLGQSPGGLNSTGKGEQRDYYDSLSSKQEKDLRPAWAQLDQILVRSALGFYPDDWSFEFNPLWQLSEREVAEIEQMRAATDAANIGAGIITPSIATGRLRDNRTYPDLTDEFVELVAEVDAEKFEEAIEPEPPAPAPEEPPVEAPEPAEELSPGEAPEPSEIPSPGSNE